MELVFLAVLILLMVIALTSGFPVAFALPGSAILAIGLAAASGYLFAGDPSAYFYQDGPVQWLTAGVTNFRSLYWDVERDTLIAIPLFVFMGIMLQRSKIAEDLLVSMAQLFGPIPGGLGMSVVFVGALLAATTGIVGATVIAMGLISLPAMLRNNYSKPLATGTICASGTLGQIIPPSIVLIILADQLSSAADQASTARKAAFREATGQFSMPSQFDVTSASAGDMFMGAFLPGLTLVALYMIYILISAMIKPESAPPVPYEGKYDRRFALQVLLALVPPLTLIFAVLGSIVLGVATVNQAGAIGSIGAMIMGGYRLSLGRRGAYYPAILAALSTAAILVVLSLYDINVKNIRGSEDVLAITLAAIAVVGLLVAVLWSAWRAFKIDDTLSGVMVETAKTTSMVFIILIGAVSYTRAKQGDTLLDVARRYGLGYEEIRDANPTVDTWLPGAGARVRLPTRFILPKGPREGIVINVAEMRLYYYPPPKGDNPPVVDSFPISIGRGDWNTPMMLTQVTAKVTDPAWYPPASIRAEHAADGKPLPMRVDPGEDNPLGKYALRLRNSSYLIHGTNKDFGIGMQVTHGCIRLYPEDIALLFHDVPKGTPVRIINEPYKVGWENDRLYLEIHPLLEGTAEAARQNRTPLVQTLITATTERADYPIDWQAVQAAEQQQSGIPTPVGPAFTTVSDAEH